MVCWVTPAYIQYDGCRYIHSYVVSFYMQASRRGSKPKPNELQQEPVEVHCDTTESEPHYTEVGSLVSANSTVEQAEPVPQLSTSRLLKSLKAPQYDLSLIHI